MAGGQFYTVVMQQTNKSFPRRLQLGKMKEKQKVKAIHRYRQQEVRDCCLVPRMRIDLTSLC